jgi:hypothetical protein
MFRAFREYFICPFCETEISFLIDESYANEYECYTGCNECSMVSRFVDTLERCISCKNKAKCIGVPEPIIFAHRIDTENLKGDLRA